MLAESMWEVMSSWFTPPTLLFLLLNFTIATIYVTSSSSHKPPHQKPDSQEELHLTRTTSVLQRLKSVNFYNYASHDSPAPPLAQALVLPAEIEPVLHQSDEAENRFEDDENIENEWVGYPSDRFDDEIEIGGEKSLDEVYSQLQRGSHNRSKSDMEPSSGVVAAKLVKKMKKSASSKSTFRHFKEEEILETRRPAKDKAEDEEVDSKADDFINKFKKQLQLQRLDSILRYKDMLGRGAHK